jgi:hypothetical protein
MMDATTGDTAQGATTTGDASGGDIPHAQGPNGRIITDEQRATMVRAAVGGLGRDQLREALALTADPRFQVPTAVGNAINALRKHRDPASVIGRVQYRPVVPYLAAAASDACLTRTIEVLGDHSDDPTREQLLAALDALEGEFAATTMAVMLASVADADMPSSDLCFGLLEAEGRFGLTGWAEGAGQAADPLADRGGQSTGSGAGSPTRPAGGATPEQREARRLKKQKDAEERRKKMEAARKASEEVRRARKRERTSGTPTSRQHPGYPQHRGRASPHGSPGEPT